jgi:hypothetical protein
MKRSIPPVLIKLALICFVLLPNAQAVVPPPDGGYPNFTTAEGTKALQSLTTGSANTAVGWSSLLSNAAGSFNTGVGAGTLALNTGDSNTAVGAIALLLNTTGNSNTAVGNSVLTNNIAGSQNTANGRFTLFSNTTGNSNTANGTVALYSNTTGHFNTANGGGALFSNTDGSFNTANGALALYGNTNGQDNTALGFNAGTMVFTASNVTCIGANAVGADVSNTTWIGNVYGVPTQSGTTAPVVVSDTGQLGTVASSERFKKDISTMHKASEAILSLRPVTFHYKKDTRGIPQFGLIAEEVAKVNSALVLPDKEGKPYTVRYEAVNAMLLNEFLKEHVAFLSEQRKVEHLEKQVAAITAGLQKVSAQLEASKPAPQVVNNP